MVNNNEYKLSTGFIVDIWIYQDDKLIPESLRWAFYVEYGGNLLLKCTRKDKSTVEPRSYERHLFERNLNLVTMKRINHLL